jgi:hypothetical protein
MNDSDQLHLGVIVCGHIAEERAPVLRGERSVPEEDADSGWQFLCGARDEDWKRARVWSLGEILEFEPSLASYVDMPPTFVVSRPAPGASWKVGQAAEPGD